MRLLRQSTQMAVPFGPAVDPADGVTLVSGGTAIAAFDHAVTGIKLRKNTGGYAVRSSVVDTVYGDYGQFTVTLTAIDTNTLGHLRVAFADASIMLPIWEDFMVVPAMVYDSLILGSDRFDANVSHWNDLAAVALPLAPTTAGRTLDVSAGGEAGVDWANVGTPGSTVNLSATTTNLVNTVTTYTGNTVQTGDAFGRVGAAGAGLTALGDTRVANLDAAVTSRMATYAQPTGFLAATFPATVASSTNISAATVTLAAAQAFYAPAKAGDAMTLTSGYDAAKTAAQASAVGSALTIIAGYIDTEIAAIQLVTDRLATAIELDGSVYRFTANALELAPGGGGSDPLESAVPGSYAVGTAGYVLGGLSAGSGARTVVFTVTDEDDVPLEGARVRTSKGAENYVSLTDADGLVTLSRDDGTWAVAITLGGFEFAPTTFEVAADSLTETYQLTSAAFSPSSSELTAGYTYVYGAGTVPVEGISVVARAVAIVNATISGMILDHAPALEVSDADGLVLFRQLVPGVKYSFTCRNRVKLVTIPLAAAGGSYRLPIFL